MRLDTAWFNVLICVDSAHNLVVTLTDLEHILLDRIHYIITMRKHGHFTNTASKYTKKDITLNPRQSDK